MAEDWDLYAVVRSCTTARTAGAAGSVTSKIESENPLASLIFEDDGGGEAFGFPNLERPRNNAFEELNQLYRPFFQAAGDASFSNFGGFELKSIYFAPENEKLKVEGKVSDGSLLGAKHQTPCVQQHQQQQREAHHQGIREEAAGTSGSVLPMLAAPPQISANRSRKRKSQQKKMVCEVTAENLSSDMWAWRKYGQKPIKGSPYPRNYYKCSTSKGCSARKQVEKSTTDPNIFVVTYTGEHIHPRPVHRNSLAGSTRNKFACAPKSGNQDSDHPNNNNNNPSCCSPLSIASFSPRTPLTSPVDEDPVKAEELDEDDLLIPNRAMTEDIFMGLQEMGYGGAGFGRRDPKPEPSWTVAADV